MDTDKEQVLIKNPIKITSLGDLFQAQEQDKPQPSVNVKNKNSYQEVSPNVNTHTMEILH
jgi:hypothetical protein